MKKFILVTALFASVSAHAESVPLTYWGQFQASAISGYSAKTNGAFTELTEAKVAYSNDGNKEMYIQVHGFSNGKYVDSCNLADFDSYDNSGSALGLATGVGYVNHTPVRVFVYCSYDSADNANILTISPSSNKGKKFLVDEFKRGDFVDFGYDKHIAKFTTKGFKAIYDSMVSEAL